MRLSDMLLFKDPIIRQFLDFSIKAENFPENSVSVNISSQISRYNSAGKKKKLAS